MVFLYIMMMMMIMMMIMMMMMMMMMMVKKKQVYNAPVSSTVAHDAFQDIVEVF